jgi:hypothetical protein
MMQLDLSYCGHSFGRKHVGIDGGVCMCTERREQLMWQGLNTNLNKLVTVVEYKQFVLHIFIHCDYVLIN